MTGQQEGFGAEETQDDPVGTDETFTEEENPGDYAPGGRTGGVSEDTGVIYDNTGEPEATPHDELLDEGEDAESAPGVNAASSGGTEE